MKLQKDTILLDKMAKCLEYITFIFNKFFNIDEMFSILGLPRETVCKMWKNAKLCVINRDHLFFSGLTSFAHEYNTCIPLKYNTLTFFFSLYDFYF